MCTFLPMMSPLFIIPMIWPQLWFQSLHGEAMAPTTSRPHSHRATSDVENPGGIRAHGLLDQVPFQLASTHFLIDPFWSLWITLRYRSWPIQVNVITHYTVSWPNHNFRCTTAGELEALFTWTRQIPPDEAPSIQFSHIDNSSSYSVGHPHGTIRFGVPLRWPFRQCL